MQNTDMWPNCLLIICTLAAMFDYTAEQNEPKMKKHLVHRCASSFSYVLHIRWDFNIIHVNRIAVMNRTVQTNLQTTKEVFKITFIFSALSSTFSFTLKSWMATYSQVDLVVLL